jgi:hypothetical protein
MGTNEELKKALEEMSAHELFEQLHECLCSVGAINSNTGNHQQRMNWR